MTEVYGNLWDYVDLPWHVVCITTNGSINSSGRAVMGRGCALEAKTRYPKIARELAEKITANGNVVQSLVAGDVEIISFPVKHKWFERADVKLIEKSADRLREIAMNHTDLNFVLPRPGCGNGHLLWLEVKPIVDKLPDNVLVITR